MAIVLFSKGSYLPVSAGNLTFLYYQKDHGDIAKSPWKDLIREGSYFKITDC